MSAHTQKITFFMLLKARSSVATDNLAMMSQSSCDSNHFKNVLRTLGFRDTNLLLAGIYSICAMAIELVLVSSFTILQHK